MKAVRLHEQGADGIVYEDAPQRQPGPGAVLVRVVAAAVTRTELEWSPTWQTASGAPRSLTIPGHEFSGTITAVGDGVTDLRAGQDVFGIIDAWYDDGAQAEFAIAQVEGVAIKPDHVPHVDAAVVPISGLTAWQALIDRASLSAGQRVLIHGAAGGVGTFAVQLAHWKRADVIATASAHNVDFVRGLGADVVIDHRSQRFEDAAHDVDVVLDTVGGETRERSLGVLKPGGTLISVATDSSETPYFFYVQANRRQLTALAGLIDEGVLTPIVDSVLPLDRARDAYARKPERGKTVLVVRSQC